MHLIPRSLVCFVASFLCLLAQAKPMEELYRVREPVSSQQPAVRDEALKHSLDTLLVRLTGRAEVLAVPALAAVRANPQQWITRYGYENSRLVVDFDPATVQSGLRQANLSWWGADRPSVLTWWLTDSTQGTQLLADGQGTAALVREKAQYRGIPVLIPIGDLSEQLAVTPDVLHSGAVEPLQAAAARYAAEGLLSVYAHSEGEAWQADWQLWVGDHQGRGQVTATSLPNLADAVFLAAQGFLAPFYLGKSITASVPATPPSESFFLEVQGASLARFAALERILTAGRLVFVDGDRLLYRLDGVSREAVKTQLMQAQLQEISGAETTPAPLVTNTSALRYRWQ